MFYNNNKNTNYYIVYNSIAYYRIVYIVVFTFFLFSLLRASETQS